MRAFSHVRLDAIPGLDFLVRSGSSGVSLFLVLSGFCLYLPWAERRRDGMEFRGFMARRARRLLPAYYATLAVLIITAVVAQGNAGFTWYSGPDLAAQTLLHVTLVHQFFPQSFYAVNGSFWTLGLEWELYLAFPLLLWGITRFGIARTVVAVVAINAGYRLGLDIAIHTGALRAHGLWATAVLPNLITGRWAEFAFGMVGAELYGSARVAR